MLRGDAIISSVTSFPIKKSPCCCYKRDSIILASCSRHATSVEVCRDSRRPQSDCFARYYVSSRHCERLGPATLVRSAEAMRQVVEILAVPSPRIGQSEPAPKPRLCKNQARRAHRGPSFHQSHLVPANQTGRFATSRVLHTYGCFAHITGHYRGIDLIRQE
jgi:hypothetical protein